jgi:flagellar biosynthesis/type III secretory pathway chaperone
MSRAAALAETLNKQDEILSELLSIMLRQREALKDGRLSDLQNLMSEMRHTSVRAQAIETKRNRAAAEISGELECPSIVSEIARALPREDAAKIAEAAKKLMSTVDKLKMEMTVLARLMDEAKSLNEMLIAEWRRLGAKSVGTGSGVFDARI